MSGREAKFCLDRNGVRWVLLEGVIHRKGAQDDPMGGKELPVAQIQRIDKTAVERRTRSPLALPATYAGLVLLALFSWMATSFWWLALPGLILGGILMLWGLMRMSGQVERLDAFQIVASGTAPEEWYVVGSHHEVLGFIEGVQAELEQIQGQQAAARN